MKIKKNKFKVTVVMGSQSDYSTMKYCKNEMHYAFQAKI